MESELGISGIEGSPSSETRSTDGLEDKARELSATVRGRAMTALDSNKDQISGAIEKMADAVEGERFGKYTAQYARRGAEYLRSHSAEDMLSSARGELRERPLVVLGACFLAGLAFSRVLKG
jgi:hypothetical protein